MTRNLKWYLVFSVSWSVVFFATLDWGLAGGQHRWPLAIAGIVYGLGFALLGYLLGRPDDQSAVRYSLRHAYAAVSSVASATIGVAWLVLFRPPGMMSALPFYVIVIAVIAALGVWYARRSIKGMSPEELFR